MSYPIWWDSTITVYNKYEDPQTHVITWFRTQLSGVFYHHVKEKITVGTETLEVDKIICRVPENDAFLEKYLWLQLPNDKMGDHFTFGRGDIVVKGAVDDDIDEYQSGHRSTDLVAKYKELQGCFVIDLVSNNTGAGRCEPHYRVEGI